MQAEFDQFADKYESTMERACAISGESPDFYAFERMQWCARRLRPWMPFDTILDFGSGVGGSLPHFFATLGCKRVIAVDPSAESLRVAQERYPNLNVTFSIPENFTPAGNIPLAFCNGVFHHIAPGQRLEALNYIRGVLSNDGIFAFWENNPWNPIVVYSMSLNEFDRNAETLSPYHAARLLKSAGFRIRFIDYRFFFPRFAKVFRSIEPALKWLPVGAQYLVVAQKWSLQSG